MAYRSARASTAYKGDSMQDHEEDVQRDLCEIFLNRISIGFPPTYIFGPHRYQHEAWATGPHDRYLARTSPEFQTNMPVAYKRTLGNYISFVNALSTIPIDAI